METVLPREVRKLASVIEEKDAALALLNDDLYCFFLYLVTGYKKIFLTKKNYK